MDVSVAGLRVKRSSRIQCVVLCCVVLYGMFRVVLHCSLPYQSCCTKLHTRVCRAAPGSLGTSCLPCMSCAFCKYRPYDGLFLPYADWWLNLGPINQGLEQYNVTYARIDAYYAAIQAQGFHRFVCMEVEFAVREGGEGLRRDRTLPF
jgi:hypothetical protein